MQIFHFFILIQNNNKKNALKFKTHNWLALLQLYLLIWGECPISSDDEGVGGTILGACGYLYNGRLVVQAHTGLGQDTLAILVTYCLNLRRKQNLCYSLHTGLHLLPDMLTEKTFIQGLSAWFQCLYYKWWLFMNLYITWTSILIETS